MKTKNRITRLALAAMAALTLAGCDKAATTDAPPQEQQTFDLAAMNFEVGATKAAPDGAQTRAALKTEWSDGDRIVVLFEQSPSKYAVLAYQASDQTWTRLNAEGTLSAATGRAWAFHAGSSETLAYYGYMITNIDFGGELLLTDGGTYAVEDGTARLTLTMSRHLTTTIVMENKEAKESDNVLTMLGGSGIRVRVENELPVSMLGDGFTEAVPKLFEWSSASRMATDDHAYTTATEVVYHVYVPLPEADTRFDVRLPNGNVYSRTYTGKELAAGGVYNIAGPLSADPAQTAEWVITATGTDITKPQIVRQVPASGATEVAVNGDIVIEFNETMDTGYGNVKFNFTGATTLPGEWSADGRTYTAHYSNLNYRQNYTVLISGFYDLEGNGYGSAESTQLTSFTTMADPNPPFSVKSVAAGGEHVLAIAKDGTLWAWGRNNYGQVGNESTADQNRPVKISSDTDWASVAAGGYHSLAVKNDGTMYAWGWNSYGQLGLGDNNNRNKPTKLPNATNVASVAAGGWHTLVLNSAGELWACGYNSNGQLGLNDTNNRNSHAKVGEGYAAIAAGNNHSLAVQTDGSLWAWGANNYGQLGLGNTNTPYKTPQRVGNDQGWHFVSAGYNHSIAVALTGDLWAWGRNSNGQVGYGSASTFESSPIRISQMNWASVSAGQEFSVATTTYGSMYGWGYNGNGQLGTGNNTSTSAPAAVQSSNTWRFVSAGTQFAVGIASGNDGYYHVYTWGANAYGQLGLGDTADRNAPTLVPKP